MTISRRSSGPTECEVAAVTSVGEHGAAHVAGVGVSVVHEKCLYTDLYFMFDSDIYNQIQIRTLVLHELLTCCCVRQVGDTVVGVYGSSQSSINGKGGWVGSYDKILQEIKLANYPITLVMRRRILSSGVN